MQVHACDGQNSRQPPGLLSAAYTHTFAPLDYFVILMRFILKPVSLKKFAALLLLPLSFAAKAQPVINSGTFTTAGTILNYNQASPLWLAGFNPETTGANASWNVQSFEGIGTVTDAYVAVTTTPPAYQFFFNNQFFYPANVSNHALPINTAGIDLPVELPVNDAFAFFRNGNNGYFATGFAASVPEFPLPITVPYTDTDRIYQWPLNFGNTFTDNSSLTLTLPSIGYYAQTGSRTSTADGWGTLTTPYGTYQVLRVKSDILITDSIFLEETGEGVLVERPLQTDFTWLSPQVPGPVLQVSVIGGQPLTGRVLLGVGPLSASLPVLEGVEVYPNPAVDMVQITGLEHLTEVRLFSLDGKVVYAAQLQPGMARIELPTLPAGIYVLSMQNEAGAFATRIAVQR